LKGPRPENGGLSLRSLKLAEDATGEGIVGGGRVGGGPGGIARRSNNGISDWAAFPAQLTHAHRVVCLAVPACLVVELSAHEGSPRRP